MWFNCARTLSPLLFWMRYTLPLRDRVTPSDRARDVPSATVLLLPSIISRVGATQIAMLVLPIFVATALLTAAFGQVGAPDAWLVMEEQPRNRFPPAKVARCLDIGMRAVDGCQMAAADADAGRQRPTPDSVKTIAGSRRPRLVQLPVRLRLLLSAVLPAKVDAQLGAFAVPFTGATCSLRDAVVVWVKKVSVGRQSPTRFLYSTAIYLVAQVGRCRIGGEPSVPFASVAMAVSLPPPWVLPMTRRLPRSDRGTSDVPAAKTFRKHPGTVFGTLPLYSTTMRGCLGACLDRCCCG